MGLHTVCGVTRQGSLSPVAHSLHIMVSVQVVKWVLHSTGMHKVEAAAESKTNC